MFTKIFSRSEAVSTVASPKFRKIWTPNEQGLLFPLRVTDADWEVGAYLEQLHEEDLVTQLSENWLLPWDSIYRLLNAEDHVSSIPLLALPPINQLRPQLASEGSIADPQFSVFIKGWVDPLIGGTVQLSRTGAIAEYANQQTLFPEASWQLLQSVRSLKLNQQEAPSESTNQMGWSRIRKVAEKAGAEMDGFLTKTVILRPESLHLKMRKSGIESTPVIEIEPTFDGQPANWLSAFDGQNQVQDRYRILNKDGGVTHVLITPEVKSVLETVRAMPGRRVTGDSALSFVRNPYSFLGDDAVKVLDADKYEEELVDAGIHFHKFSLTPVLSDDGRHINFISMLLEPISSTPLPATELRFSAAHEFAPLVQELRLKYAAGLPGGFWKGFELDVSGIDLDQVQGLEALLERWKKEAAGVEFDSVLDLSQYGDRVVGIGVAEHISSPFLVKQSTENWLPANVLNLLGLDGSLLARWDSSSQEDCDEFGERIEQSKLANEEQVLLPRLEIPLDLTTATQLHGAWAEKFKDKQSQPNEDKVERAVLLIEQNIEESSYIAQREGALRMGHSASADLPEALREEVELREHQRKGVAWLQHLFNLSPVHVSGCLLADDMGLGKTLQLLSFIVWYIEQNPDGEPVLIVAPVSLLDNWERELERFFYTTETPYLKLYGKTLNPFKFRKEEIPGDLHQKGIKNLLKPGWRGDAKIVLTTYETLRDQEFSLARQKWAIVVCDEAQKIKNPAAMITQAAIAMTARFRVACTGTPVENSLTDLWCLFDFIQPGLLGSLNEFGAKYRRPIEANTDRDFDALSELRALIDPQILRRMKSDVAKDLPLKIEDKVCRSLPIERMQRDLYLSELTRFTETQALLEKVDSRGGGMLGLLHTLKLICAHPFSVRPQQVLRDNSPKLRWLVMTLNAIRQQGEKVIIFTELRDIQREVQHLLQKEFGFQAPVINGDTNASSQNGTSRQGIIDEFQEQPGFGVIILSTVAVGFGVNVQAANHVIHFTRSWNPAKEDQATDRAYRIGQQKNVTVYYPTVVDSEFMTFEQTLDQLLEKKRSLAGDMLNGVSDIATSEFAQILAKAP